MMQLKGGIRLTEHVRFQAIDMLLLGFQGFVKRKNKVSVGEVMVMLLVPLAVLTPPLADQLAGVDRLLFCRKVQPETFCQYTVTAPMDWLM